MNRTENRSLVTLLALKAICCGGILLALGGVSVGGITAALDNGWVQGAGIALIVAGAVRYATVRRNHRHHKAHDSMATGILATGQAEK